MASDMVPVVPPTIRTVRVPDQAGGGERVTRQLLLTLCKWKRLILGLTVAFVVAAAVAMILKAPVRTATAKILVKSDRTPLTISGLSSPSSKMPYSPQVLQSEVEMFKSREVLLPVARQLLAERRKQPAEAIPAADVEEAIEDLRSDLAPVALPDTNVIQVTYFAATSERAITTLERVFDQYMRAHSEAYSGSGRLLKFYERERDRLGTELAAEEERLRQWQAATRVVSVEGETASHLQMLADRERALAQTTAELQALRSRIEQVRAQLAGQPERILVTHEQVRNPVLARLEGDLAAAEAAMRDTERNPLVAKLRADLVTAEVALHDQRQRYTDKDRSVVEKQEQVAMLKRELDTAVRAGEQAGEERVAALRRELEAARSQGDVVGRRTTEPNPLRDALQKELGHGVGQLSALTSQKLELEKQVGHLATALAGFRDKKIEADRRARAIALRQDAYLLYGKKLEEAHISAGLDREHLANIAVIEKPYATPYSDLVKRLALVVLAGLVGFAAGTGIAFSREFFSNSLRTPDDIEYYVGLPVLATIPAFPKPPLALAR